MIDEETQGDSAASSEFDDPIGPHQFDEGLDLLLAAGLIHARLHPMDLAQIDTRRFRQEPACIDAGGLRPFRNAHALSFQVPGGGDASVGAHVKCRVPEYA